MSLLDGLISYWRLDEASGTRYDAHGSNDLTPVNTPGSGAGKLGNGSTHVRASSQYLTVAHAANQNPANITITGWLNASATSMGTGRGIVTKFNDTALQNSYYVHLFSTNRIGFSVTTTGNVSATFGSAISADTWYFFAARYDGSNVSISQNNGTPVTAAQTGNINAGTAALQVGAYRAVANFGGTLDDIGIWNRALSDAEITELYNSYNGLAYPFGIVTAQRKPIWYL